MSLSKKSVRILLVVGVILGIIVGPSLAVVTSPSAYELQSPVHLNATDGPEVIVDRSLHTTQITFPDNKHVDIEGHLNVTAGSGDDVTLLKSSSSWVTVDLNASNDVTLNATGKQVIEADEGIDRLSFRDVRANDGRSDFKYNGSGTLVKIHDIPENSTVFAVEQSTSEVMVKNNTTESGVLWLNLDQTESVTNIRLVSSDIPVVGPSSALGGMIPLAVGILLGGSGSAYLLYRRFVKTQDRVYIQ